MDQKDLKAIIEQVLSEMHITGDTAKAATAAVQEACTSGTCSQIEEGCIPDVTEVDIRTQYLVKIRSTVRSMPS